MVEKFPCDDDCGACCKFVLGHLPVKPGTSECIMLKDNRCMVYENRPLVCDIRKLYESRGSKGSWEETIKANRAACAELQRMTGWKKK